MWIFLLFLAIPFIEIALFIEVGGLIGLWPTLGLVLLAAMIGLAVMRRQGLQSLRRLQASVEAGQDPSGPLADGALVLIAGILLLLPGFFTDILGLALLVPPIRAALIRRAAGRIVARSAAFGRPSAQRRRPARTETIDGDYQVLDDVPPAERGASGWTRPQS